MKITADNRGRIALGKLDRVNFLKMGVSHLPGAEWEVTYDNMSLTVKPWNEGPKEEWVKIYPEGLRPHHIGQVVGLQGRIDSVTPLAIMKDPTRQDAVWGVLENYSMGGQVEIRLKGNPNTYTNNVGGDSAAVQYVIVPNE